MTMPNLPGDPSPRTLEQVRMAIENLRELFEAKFDNIETRFSETEKALKLHQENLDRQPTQSVLDERLIALKESVDIRFQGLKELASTLAASNEKKLELALSSQQEAAKENKAAFQQLLRSLDDKVNDVKDRTLVLTNTDKTAKDSATASKSMMAIIISAVGVIMAIAVGITIMSRGG
jgi:hypothetical protein